jgi:FkbM family methyltransferase
MTLPVDPSPFGRRAPGALDRMVISLTRRLPANRLGVRAAVLLRRLTTSRLGAGGLDVSAFGVKLRLYPRGNAWEKGALFTPQMFDKTERDGLERAVAAAKAEGRPFLFVDAGANVGLYALLAMRLADGAGRALAIEPQPGILDRLAFNVAANPGLDVRPVGVAVAEKEGEVEFFIDPRDCGGSRIGGSGVGTSVTLRARKLLDIMAEEGFAGPDVLKIDIEAAEDLVLEPFLREAAEDALPRVILLADNRAVWSRDLVGLLVDRGYRAGERSRRNMFFQR